jgi:Ca2+-binding RTX toxin-like protein
MPTPFRSFGALCVAAFALPFVPAADAFAADATTVIPLSCTIPGFSPTAGDITFDTSLPDSVEQGSSFTLDLTARDFFKIPAPYSGTISLQLKFAASSGATPSGDFISSPPPAHFDTGDPPVDLGTFQTSFVASGSPGTTIDFTFVEFTYTITLDSGPSFTATCVPSAPHVVASTVITEGCDDATIVGTPGDDVLVGTSGNDVIAAGGGNDTIMGLAGSDRVCAGEGNDTIESGSGNDRIIAGAGADIVRAGSGDDQISGDAGDDDLHGGSGHDSLDGGADTATPGDSCDGGSGPDSAIACEFLFAIP